MPRLPLLLECLLCKNKFSEVDATEGRFYLQTNICKECYEKGQRQAQSIWCFGRPLSKSSPGYDAGNVACASLCPDRRICAQFVKRYIKHKEK